MSKITDVTFRGRSGSYEFEVYSSDTTFRPVGAVYVFTKRVVNAEGKGNHTLLYIGQTDSLQVRIPTHEKWPCVQSNGVNCICVHRDDNEESRIAKETDLRDGNNTPCNDQ